MTDTLESLTAELDALPSVSKTVYATDAAKDRYWEFAWRVSAFIRTAVGDDQIEAGCRLLDRVQNTSWNCWNREEDEPYGA